MLLSRCTECETSSCKGLDAQLLYQINQTKPGLLVRIDDIKQITLGGSVHPWVQSAMRSCLIKALSKRSGIQMTINSAYRTIVGQQLLRSHVENGRCDIRAAAPPGKSNHNNASAIDVRGVTQKTAIDEWINQYSEEGKQNWSNAAERFCKYLKAAEADS
jgi:N-acetylmuramoyl-L-alanine amidase